MKLIRNLLLTVMLITGAVFAQPNEGTATVELKCVGHETIYVRKLLRSPMPGFWILEDVKGRMIYASGNCQLIITPPKATI
jgi:hypothetical protein